MMHDANDERPSKLTASHLGHWPCYKFMMYIYQEAADHNTQRQAELAAVYSRRSDAPPSVQPVADCLFLVSPLIQRIVNLVLRSRTSSSCTYQVSYRSVEWCAFQNRRTVHSLTGCEPARISRHVAHHLFPGAQAWAAWRIRAPRATYSWPFPTPANFNYHSSSCL